MKDNNPRKFWNWKSVPNSENSVENERVLTIDGTIADESWYDDDVTPALFKSELFAEKGPVTIWINSPGGDVWAAAQIYNMIRDYPYKVTAKIDGIAASAASVIAMACDEVLMSPVSTMMIHNPWTYAWGDAKDMEKVIRQLNECKETIINAYVLKTKMSREEISQLMDEETFFEVYWAIEHGFADGIIERRPIEEGVQNKVGRKFGYKASAVALLNKMNLKETEAPEETSMEPIENVEKEVFKVADLRKALDSRKS